ncbi:MAG: hypothetical protein LBT40_03345 [Deltaproteobacteria bacterium]|nr:hypothetical protein [Deltaproteobacteria bacterium]
MDLDALTLRFTNVWPYLNERQRRLFAANEAQILGHGGITIVRDICGLSRVTITKGIKELEEDPIASTRIRMPGSGRPTLITLPEKY